MRGIKANLYKERHGIGPRARPGCGGSAGAGGAGHGLREWHLRLDGPAEEELKLYRAG